MRSPFEESSVYSFGLFNNLVTDVYISTYSNASFDVVEYVSASDLMSIAFSTLHAYTDSNYVIIIYVFALHVMAYMIGSMWYSRSNSVRVFSNTIAAFVHDKIAVSYLGSNGSKYFPFILYVFYVILCGNLFGLIPGVFSITSNFSFTLYMSSICWLGILLMGIYFNGVRFFKLFYPTMVPFALSPFLMFIEVISFIVRLASLSLRLFANIVAGHILIETVSSFFSHIVVSANTGLNIEYFIGSVVLLLMVLILIIFESLIAFLQAYIFAVLLTIYMHDVFAQH